MARNSGSSFDAFEDEGLGNGNTFEEGSTSSSSNSSNSAVLTQSDEIEILSVEAEASKEGTDDFGEGNEQRRKNGNDLVSSNTAVDGGPAANGITPEVFEIVVDRSPDPVVQKVMTLEKEIVDRDDGIVTPLTGIKKDPQSIGIEKGEKRKRQDDTVSFTDSSENPRVVTSPNEDAREECETHTGRLVSQQHVGLVAREWNAGSVTLPMPNGLEFNMRSEAQNPGTRSNSSPVRVGTPGKNISSIQDKRSVVAGLMNFGEKSS